MAWRGSISRSLMSTARAFNSSPSLSSPHRLRPPHLSAPRLQRRRLSFLNPREEWKRWVMSAASQQSKAGPRQCIILGHVLGPTGVSCRDYSLSETYILKKGQFF